MFLLYIYIYIKTLSVRFTHSCTSCDLWMRLKHITAKESDPGGMFFCIRTQPVIDRQQRINSHGQTEIRFCLFLFFFCRSVTFLSYVFCYGFIIKYQKCKAVPGCGSIVKRNEKKKNQFLYNTGDVYVLKSNFVEAGLKVKLCITCWVKIKIAQALSLLNTVCVCVCVSLRE